MSSLIALTLLSVLTSGSPEQTVDRLTPTLVAPAAQVKRHKLKLIGPHIKGTPRPLGIRGVKMIPKNHFKIKDFKSYLAGPGTTVNRIKGRGFVANPTALVLYDSSGQWGWIGSLYAYQIGNLLAHFGVTVTREGVENYRTGQLASYGSAYYLGTTFYNTLPTTFLNDVITDKNNLVWMGYNLWETSWNAAGTDWNAAFTNKYGFNFDSVDGTGYPTIRYKTSTLTKQQDDPTQGNAIVNDPSIATVLATASNGSTSVPYITKGANLWYVADNPLEYVAYDRGDDRMLAFADILNDTTGVVPTTQKRAVLRIEDVGANCDSASLRNIADTLYTEGIPYVVCVIPDYKDPLGVFNGGVPLEVQVQNSPTFTADLQYMVSKGAQLIMHGVSHQYSNLPNPQNGVSAADVEFFRVETDSNGNQVAVGPVPEDSTAWVSARLASGFQMMSQAGLPTPTGWNSPHYYGTPTDYVEFGKDFQYCMDRQLTFVADSTGNLQYLIQYSPYVFNDQYNNHRIPETLGYYDPNGTSGLVNLPANMIGYAQQIQCVRGGWAGMYYHWFLGTTALKQLVDGVKALGYTFVNPSKDQN
ncbi:MAG: DUF2334 domain-containing protein [Fimbriimonas sp.]|nr:DUF2334 domain-containing protein [Fimbriimonas sp.]